MRIEWQIDSTRIAYLINPVQRCTFMLLVEAKTALQMGNPESENFQVGFPVIGLPLPEGKWHATTEALGARIIEGVVAEGSRTTHALDIEWELTSIREEWLSPSLKLTMVAEASGPGWEHKAKLQKLERHEPDPALFALPHDFKIQA